MMNKIVLLMLLSVILLSIVTISFASNGNIGNGQNDLSIDDIREKRGGSPIKISELSEEKSVIDKSIDVIVNQKLQLAVNIIIIIFIVVAVIKFKRKSRSDSKLTSYDNYNIKAEGEPNKTNTEIDIDKPALLEIIEKFFFPYFRIDILKINKQLHNLSLKIEDYKLKDDDTLRKIEQQQLKDNKLLEKILLQAAKSNEVMASVESALINESAKRQDQYKIFAVSRNMDISNIISNSYESFFQCCQNSLSIEKESAFFNHIPVEYYEKKIDNKNIIAYGTLANLLVKHLGYGKSFKHSFLNSTDSTADGDTIIPLSLLADKIDKIDTLVITNPYLAMAIIQADNILERLKDKISDTIILPIEISLPLLEVVFKNFSELEENSIGEYRWAVDFNNVSKIIIHNNTNQVKKISVKFSVVSVAVDSYLILNNDQILIEYNVEIVRDIELAPGENVLNFEFMGEKKKIGEDPRELKFSIYNFEIDGRKIMSDLSVATRDYAIRRRLHSVGFSQITSEIVANKGIFIEKLPVSKYIHSKESHTAVEVAELFRKFALNSSSTIPIIYKGYRNDKAKL